MAKKRSKKGEKKEQRQPEPLGVVEDKTAVAEVPVAAISENPEKKQGKQIKIIVAIMAVVLVSVFVVYWLVQESKTFEYKGMKFYKEKEGAILFYKSLLGYVTRSGENVPFVLKLRSDPRKLDEIAVEGIIKDFKEQVTISFSQNIANCSNTARTIVDFSITLGAFGIKTDAATNDEDYAAKNKIPFATCKDAKQKTVIIMEDAAENKIVKTGDCYTLKIKDCQTQELFERFILEFIANSRAV